MTPRIRQARADASALAAKLEGDAKRREIAAVLHAVTILIDHDQVEAAAGIAAMGLQILIADARGGLRCFSGGLA